MVVLKRFLGLAFLGLAILAVARAARPGARLVARSLRTSSSPGAGAYDIVASLLLGGYYDDIAADCAAVLAGDAADTGAGGTTPLPGPPAVLEIGPGPGHVAERLLVLLPDAHWTGLDVDPAMLDAARGRLARASLGDRAALVQGDVAALPFEDAAFDLVVSSLYASNAASPSSFARS
jgi:hypothetical protein